MQLPDKVRRGQFTAEEQILLAGGYQSVILDAADEILYKLGRHPNRSVPSLHTSFSSSPSAISSDFEGVPDSAEDMDDAMMDSFRWLDDDDLDLTLDDYHEHLADTATSSSKSTSLRRPSTRRTTSLSSVSTPRSFRPSVDIRPLYPQISNRPTDSRPSLPRLPSHYSSHDSFSPVDSSAKYYQDPEARLKLRVYLASPQKFDEAIEFGFPSLEDTPPQRPFSRRPSVSKPQASFVDGLTFLDNDKVVGPKDKDFGDSLSLAESDSPPTPVDMSFRVTSRQPQPKQSTDYARPPMMHAHTEPYMMGWGGNREMTLRMTLTRPELRADDIMLHPKEKDPLALEDLQYSPEGGDVWTKVPQKGDGMFGKLWKKVHRKS